MKLKKKGEIEINRKKEEERDCVYQRESDK